MSEITKALLRAFASLLHPRMLWLMIWPMLVSLLVWGGAALLWQPSPACARPPGLSITP